MQVPEDAQAYSLMVEQGPDTTQTLVRFPLGLPEYVEAVSYVLWKDVLGVQLPLL